MRRKARECALQLIYQLDMHGVLADGRVEPAQVDEPIRAFWASFDSVTKDEQHFADRIVEGVLRSYLRLIKRLKEHRPGGNSRGWSRWTAVSSEWRPTNSFGVMISPLQQ